MMGLESAENRYLDGRPVMNCSAETATEIDKEVLKIVKACHETAKKILEDNRDLLTEIANVLLEKETILGDEFMDIIYKKYPEKKIEKDKNTIKTNMISEEVCDYKTKIIDDIFTSPKTEVDNSQIIVGKILRKLRTENYRLLFSCYQNLEKVEIVERELCVYFDSENFKEILEKVSNLDLINDIIKEDNLKIKYIFNSQKEEKTIEDILIEKFNNIEIKE